MMKRFLLFLAFALPIFCQAGPPDCQGTDILTTTGTGTAFANKATSTGGTPCVFWVIQYYANSGNSAINLQLEGAADSTGTGTGVATGSYTALTAGCGSANPAIIAKRGTIIVSDDYPWLRFNLSSFTGGTSITIRRYGYRSIQSCATASSTVAITAPLGQQTVAASVATVVQGETADGVAIFGNSVPIGVVDNGGLEQHVAGDSQGDLVQMCNNPATVTQVYTAITTLGAQRIITGTASQKIRICKFIFSTATPEDLAILQGTGATCAGGTAATNAQMYSITAAVLDLDGGFTQSATGQDVCVNPSASQNAGLTVVYVKF